MQDNETKKYEHIAHILLAIAVTAFIAFGLGCYTGSKMEQKHEQSFYNQYIKPVADSEQELMQKLGNDLKRCQANLSEYQKVTMTSNAAQYDSIMATVKAKYDDYKAKHDELQDREKLLQEDLMDEMVKGANLQKENYSLKRELKKLKLKEDLLQKKQ
jgi:septal ring factor EnvC (AmiA/AmiB activator)